MKDLVPAFLRRIDQHLLLNHRLLWETRFHYVLFYGLVAFLGTVAFSFLVPISLKYSIPEPSYYAAGAAIAGVFSFAYWLFWHTQHSIMGNFGRQTKLMEHARLLIYFATIAVCSLPAWTLPSLLEYRIRQLATPQEIEADKVALNLGEVFFKPTESYDESQSPLGDFLRCLNEPASCNPHEYYDALFNRFPKADMEEYESDYYSYTKEAAYPSDKMDLPTLASANGVDAFELFYENKHPELVKKAIADYLDVMEKYGCQMPINAEYAYQAFVEKRGIPYNLYNNKLDDAKYEFTGKAYDIRSAYQTMRAEDFNLMLAVVPSLMFALSMLVYLYKHLSIRELLLTVVATGAAMAICGIVIAFVGNTHILSGRSMGDFVLFLFYAVYGTALAMGLRVRGNGVYSFPSIAGLSVANMATPLAILFPMLWLPIKFDSSILAENNMLAPLLTLGSCLSYYLLAFPVFKKRFLYLAALPKA